MDKLLQPESLDADPSSGEAAKVWVHWKRTFQNFLAVLPPDTLDRIGILMNYLTPKIYQYVEDCRDYPAAIETLQALYVKPTNEIYASHILATRRQQPVETLDEYLQSLKTLSKDCNYQAGTSILYHEESIRDAFITGLTLEFICQRLLENRTLDLKTMFDQARSQESAVRSSESYSAPLPPINAAIPPADVPPKLSTDSATLLQGSKGRSASSVETADILIPSALHVILHVLSAGKRGTSKGFVVEGLLRCIQREHRLQHGIRLFR